MTQTLPVVGDIISSPEFAYGRHDYDLKNPAITIGGNSKTHIVTHTHSEDERIAHAAKHGTVLPKFYDIDHGAYDPSRGTAMFVVERAEMEGGSSGSIGRYDEYPDELHITARRLFDSGLYNPEGELIEFYYPHGCHNNSVNDLTIHGHMRRVFI